MSNQYQTYFNELLASGHTEIQATSIVQLQQMQNGQQPDFTVINEAPQAPQISQPTEATVEPETEVINPKK